MKKHLLHRLFILLAVIFQFSLLPSAFSQALPFRIGPTGAYIPAASNAPSLQQIATNNGIALYSNGWMQFAGSSNVVTNGSGSISLSNSTIISPAISGGTMSNTVITNAAIDYKSSLTNIPSHILNSHIIYTNTSGSLTPLTNGEYITTAGGITFNDPTNGYLVGQGFTVINIGTNNDVIGGVSYPPSRIPVIRDVTSSTSTNTNGTPTFTTLPINYPSGSLAWSNIAAPGALLSSYGITNAATNGASLGWTQITNTPTSIAGYGITNATTNGAAVAASQLTGMNPTATNAGVTILTNGGSGTLSVTATTNSTVPITVSTNGVGNYTNPVTVTNTAQVSALDSLTDAIAKIQAQINNTTYLPQNGLLWDHDPAQGVFISNATCTSGGLCNLVNDAQGSTNTESQTNAAKYPLYFTNIVNGKPALAYSSSAMLIPGYYYDKPHTVMVVANATNNSAYAAIASCDNSGAVEYGFDGATPEHFSASYIGQATATGSITMTTNTWFVAFYTSSGKDTNIGYGNNPSWQASIKVNGQQSSGTTVYYFGSGSNTIIGSSLGTGGYFKGYIARDAAWNRVLSPSEIQAVTAQMSRLYNIPVSINPQFTLSPKGFSSWSGGKTLLTNGPGAYDAGICEVTDPYQEGGTNYYYYTGWQGTKTAPSNGTVCLATSIAGGPVTKYGVAVGTNGAPANFTGYVSGAHVQKQTNGLYTMTIFGSTNTAFEASPSSVGMLTNSTPGNTNLANAGWGWTTTNPIISPSGSTWMSQQLYFSSIQNFNGTNWLAVNGHGSGVQEYIGLFYSTNTPSQTGTNWTPWASNPVICPAGATYSGNINVSWSTIRMFDPMFYVEPNGKILMTFNGQNIFAFQTNSAQMGLAESSNMVTWTEWTNDPISIVQSSNTIIRCRFYLDQNDGIWKAIGDNIGQIFTIQNDFQQ